MPEERLQKILSQAGITSRRKAEEMIQAGRVTVNGEVLTELGSKADLERDHIKVDGTLLHSPRKHVYIMLNKPREVVTTVSDPEGRQTVMHLLRGIKERVFPVGRLDYSSEGLLLLTNDGEFAHRITAPASHLMKTYVVKVTGNLTEDQVKAFANGVPLGGRKTAPAQIKLIKTGDNPWYEVKLTEGRQNQIRMMFKHFGKLVEKLRRVKIGFLELDVAPGRFRPLSPREVEKFRHVLKLDQAPEEAGKEEAPPPPAVAAIEPRQPQSKPRFRPKPRGFAQAKAEAPDAKPAFAKPRPTETRTPTEFRGPKPDFKRGPKPDFKSGTKPDFKRGPKPDFKSGTKPDFKRGPKPDFKSGTKPDFKRGPKPDFKSGPKPDFKRGPKPDFKSGPKPDFKRGPKSDFKSGPKPDFKRGPKPTFDRGPKPAFSKDRPGPKSGFKRGPGGKPSGPSRGPGPRGPRGPRREK